MKKAPAIKRLLVAAATCSLVAVTALAAFTVCGCSSQGGDGAADGADGEASGAWVSNSQYSLVASHEALGQDVSPLEGISYASCGSCHGDYQALVDKTEAMWAGEGQIGEANPHASHASNAYACDQCHSMTEAPVNQCNQCHAFESPEGWTDPDPTTSNYGPGNTEPLY